MDIFTGTIWGTRRLPEDLPVHIFTGINVKENTCTVPYLHGTNSSNSSSSALHSPSSLLSHWDFILSLLWGFVCLFVLVFLDIWMLEPNSDHQISHFQHTCNSMAICISSAVHWQQAQKLETYPAVHRTRQCLPLFRLAGWKSSFWKDLKPEIHVFEYSKRKKTKQNKNADQN